MVATGAFDLARTAGAPVASAGVPDRAGVTERAAEVAAENVGIGVAGKVGEELQLVRQREGCRWTGWDGTQSRSAAAALAGGAALA